MEQAFTRRQLTAGAYNLRAGQREGVIPAELDPRLTIALLIGGIRQALIGALTSNYRPDRAALTDKIWVFVVGALRLPATQSARNQEDKAAKPWPIRTTFIGPRPATRRPI